MRGVLPAGSGTLAEGSLRGPIPSERGSWGDREQAWPGLWEANTSGAWDPKALAPGSHTHPAPLWPGAFERWSHHLTSPGTLFGRSTLKPIPPSLPLPRADPNVSRFPLETSWEVCLQLQPTPPICAGSAGRAETQALEVAGIQGTAALPGLRSPHNWPPESEFMLLQSPVPVPVCTGVHRSNPEHASSGTQSPPRKDATHMCRHRPRHAGSTLIQHAHPGMQALRWDSLRPPQNPPASRGTGSLGTAQACPPPDGGCPPTPWPQRSGCSPHQVIWRCPQHLCCCCWQEVCEACQFEHSGLHAYFSRAAGIGTGHRHRPAGSGPRWKEACPCEDDHHVLRH